MMFEINNKIIKIGEKLGFGDMVILSTLNDRKQVRFANGEITIAKRWLEKKTEIFVEKDKRLVSTEISNYEEEHIENVMNNLAKLINSVEKKEDYYGIAEGPFKYGDIEKTFDSKVLETDPIEPIEAAINATSLDRVAGVLYVDHPQTFLTTSNNVEAKDEGTGIEISVRAFKDDLASGHSTNSSRVLSDFKPEEAGKKAGEIARMVHNPEVGESGKFDVIFEPMSIGNLLSTMGEFASAMAVEAGFSFLVNKIGKKVATEDFTFRDIGNLPNGYGTRKFDDEGVPTKSTDIIKDGTLQTYLLNSSYAKKYNMENTSNSGIIMPHPWNLYVEPGNYKEEEIFDVKKGIFVTNIWYTRFQNYVTGDFSTIPRDGIFLVENGEIKKAIKNIRVSDNIQRMLMGIDAIGRELRQVHWWEAEIPIFVPYIRVKDVGITKATQ